MVALVRHGGAKAEPVWAAGVDLTDAVLLVPRICAVDDCNQEGQLRGRKFNVNSFFFFSSFARRIQKPAQPHISRAAESSPGGWARPEATALSPALVTRIHPSCPARRHPREACPSSWSEALPCTNRTLTSPAWAVTGSHTCPSGAWPSYSGCRVPHTRWLPRQSLFMAGGAWKLF